MAVVRSEKLFFWPSLIQDLRASPLRTIPLRWVCITAVCSLSSPSHITPFDFDRSSDIKIISHLLPCAYVITLFSRFLFLSWTDNRCRFHAVTVILGCPSGGVGNLLCLLFCLRASRCSSVGRLIFPLLVFSPLSESFCRRRCCAGFLQLSMPLVSSSSGSCPGWRQGLFGSSLCGSSLVSVGPCAGLSQVFVPLGSPSADSWSRWGQGACSLGTLVSVPFASFGSCAGFSQGFSPLVSTSGNSLLGFDRAELHLVHSNAYRLALASCWISCRDRPLHPCCIHCSHHVHFTLLLVTFFLHSPHSVGPGFFSTSPALVIS